MNSPAIQLFRCSQFFYRRGFRRTSYLVNVVNRLFFSAWLPGSARVGEGLIVGYWGLGIVIHNNTVIGKNCWICQNVTIGRNFSDRQVPHIGDNVYIGAGSVLFGEITVGDNVFIGSNCVVNSSIPDNCTVVGNPMRIVSTNNSKNHIELRALDKGGMM
ncbi:serine O-acetyltransferase [Neolewinella persica]|uniref:serine O-acetyltransferase n=1 Tax=Neolewinella persica TaxID=70998 RepID=UPI00036D40F0|nr:DapH/DapD/GlmU-related protein [Neolewinella persica]